MRPGARPSQHLAELGAGRRDRAPRAPRSPPAAARTPGASRRTAATTRASAGIELAARRREADRRHVRPGRDRRRQHRRGRRGAAGRRRRRPRPCPAATPSRAAAAGIARDEPDVGERRARAAASAGARAPGRPSRRPRARDASSRASARTDSADGGRRAQPRDLLAVHQREAGAGRGVEQADHRRVRLEPQLDVAREDADELDDDRDRRAAARPSSAPSRARRPRTGAAAPSKAPDESAMQAPRKRRRAAPPGSRSDSTSDLRQDAAPTRRLLQVWTPFADRAIVETPSFTFRLERVRTLRERAEERAREALTDELRNPRGG